MCQRPEWIRIGDSLYSLLLSMLSLNAKEVNLKDAGDGENKTAFEEMVRTRLRAFGTNKLENM